MIIRSESRIPILAPEIVLLYKAAQPEDSAAASDFQNILPSLTLDRADWLSAALKKGYTGHIWLKDLEEGKKR